MRIHTVGFVATADVTPKTRTDHTNGMARVPCPSPGVRFPKARVVVLETVCITTVSLQNDGEQASRSAGRVARRILAVVPPYHHDLTITSPQTLRCPATMLLIASSISPCSVMIQIVSKTTVLAFGNRTPGLGHGTRAIPFM